MVARKILHIRRLAHGHDSPRRAVLVRVLLCLALVVLIAGAARPASGAPGVGSTQRIYVRQDGGIWVSDDAGNSWTPAAALPSQALSLAAAGSAGGPVFVGTESLGLLRSDDGGESWQPVDSTALGHDQGAPVAVTALAINPENEQVVYAAINVWLGTNTAHLTPLGIAVSVDGGRQWLQMSRARPGDLPLQGLEPVAGQPLTLVTVDSAGSHTVDLTLGPPLWDLFQDTVPAIRA